MLTRIDHIMICVPDLERGIEMYRRLGMPKHVELAETMVREL